MSNQTDEVNKLLTGMQTVLLRWMGENKGSNPAMTTAIVSYFALQKCRYYMNKDEWMLEDGIDDTEKEMKDIKAIASELKRWLEENDGANFMDMADALNLREHLKRFIRRYVYLIRRGRMPDQLHFMGCKRSRIDPSTCVCRTMSLQLKQIKWLAYRLCLPYCDDEEMRTVSKPVLIDNYLE